MRWLPSVSDSEDPDVELSPCQRLWLNVIHRAVHDIVHYHESLRHSLDYSTRMRNLNIAKESKKWVMSNDLEEGGFLWAVEAVFVEKDLDYAVTRIREVCNIDL